MKNEQTTPSHNDRLDRADGASTAGRRPEQAAGTGGRDVQGAQAERATPPAERRDQPDRLNRRYVALDLETTSLDTRVAFPLEIAAVEIRLDDPGVYGRVLTFVPYHVPGVLHRADPEALAVNRYYERRLFEQMSSSAATDQLIDELTTMLDGATLVGANPAYDADVLLAWLRARGRAKDAAPWHFRLYDVEVATAAALGLDRIPGLSTCAEVWGLDTDPSVAHTAAGDAFLTADVFAAVYNHHRSAAQAESGGQNGRGGVL